MATRRTGSSGYDRSRRNDNYTPEHWRTSSDGDGVDDYEAETPSQVDAEELIRIPLTDVQLDKILDDVPGYLGCYMRDGIPQDLSVRSGYILNLDTSEGEGTHWTAIMHVRPTMTSPYHVCYYDSFGFPPPEELTDTYGDILYNTHNHQPYDSATCGWYCAYVLDRCLRKRKPFLEVIYKLRPGTSDSMASVGDKANDEMVLEEMVESE